MQPNLDRITAERQDGTIESAVPLQAPFAGGSSGSTPFTPWPIHRCHVLRMPPESSQSLPTSPSPDMLNQKWLRPILGNPFHPQQSHCCQTPRMSLDSTQNLLLRGNLDFKFRIKIWNIFLGDSEILKTYCTFELLEYPSFPRIFLVVSMWKMSCYQCLYSSR